MLENVQSNYFEKVDPKEELPEVSGYYFFNHKYHGDQVVKYNTTKNRFWYQGNELDISNVTYWIRPI